MKKHIVILISVLTATLFLIGCSNSDTNAKNSISTFPINEAKKIAMEQGYSFKSESDSGTEIMIGDSDVFKLIKDASLKGGYSEDGFDSLSDERKIIGYELKNKPIMLCLIIDKEKVIGACLDYYKEDTGIEPLDIKGNTK